MTSVSEDGRNIVKLELSHVDTIHVTSGAEKIASLCIVVKDTEAVEGLQVNPQPIPKMIITDVVPLKDDPTRAEIFFRHLTAQEILEENRRFLMPSGSLDQMFGTFFNGAAEDFYEEDDEDLTDEDPRFLDDEDNEGGGTLLENKGLVPDALDNYDDNSEVSPLEEDEQKLDDSSATSQNVEDTFNKILAETKDNLEKIAPGSAEILANVFDKMANTVSSMVKTNDDMNLYSVTISLAEAHLGQMLCVSTNAPAFVLTSDAGFDAISSTKEKNVWEDFLAILEFPYPDTSEYFDSTATLIQSVTGSFPLNVNIEDINRLRAHLMDKVIGMSNGRVESLVETFGFINPMNKAFKNRNKNIKPTMEDSLQLVTMDAVEKIYEVTTPAVIASLVKATPFTQQSIAEMETLDNLLASSGLNESFGDILAEEYEKKPLKLSSSPTTEELIAYYSAPATKSSFPAALEGLVSRIQMPLFYAHNWVGGNVELEETKTNIGEINVSKIIAVAIRFARLKEIVEHVEDKFVPVALILRALNFPSETSTWAYLESIKIMSRNANKKKSDDLFTELMLPGLPNGDDEVEIVPEQILMTPGATIMHKVAHLILDDAWDKGILISKANTSLLNDFIDEVYLLADEVEESENSASHNKPCPIMKSVFTYFASNQSSEETVKELGQVILALAELNVLKNTNYVQDSQEWVDYVENYYGILFKN